MSQSHYKTDQRRATARRNGKLDVGDAALYYEVVGQGPALVMISGAGGDAGFYSEAADTLADTFTVVTYDRRGNSRSTGRADARMSISQQASDAKAVIDACAGERAVVFGNSAGAIIGLALAAAHPGSVIGLIAHEPPIVTLLHEDEPERVFLSRVLTIVQDRGFAAAAKTFLEESRDIGAFEFPPGVGERFQGNLEHFFTHEYPEIIGFTPDLDGLKASGVPIVLASGAWNRGYARPAQVMAALLKTAWAEIPGHHLSFMERPEAFAIALCALASELFTRVGGVPEPWRTPRATAE